MRAIQSVLAQVGVEVLVLVVANGPQCDERLLEKISVLSGVQLLRMAAPSMPLALEFGRDHVKTPFFGELDDDDVYLEGGLRRLLDALLTDTDADVVVANCIIRRDGGNDVRRILDIQSVRNNPLDALMNSTWLGPGGALFRSDSVPSQVFSQIPKYLEWTGLGVILCLNHRLMFVDDPVSIHYQGLAHSVDESRDARIGRAKSLARILAFSLPLHIRRCLRVKLGATLHACAMQHIADGDLADAWRCHIKSLFCPRGWRYITFTRYLFLLR